MKINEKKCFSWLNYGHATIFRMNLGNCNRWVKLWAHFVSDGPYHLITSNTGYNVDLAKSGNHYSDMAICVAVHVEFLFKIFSFLHFKYLFIFLF